ncbi:MAG: hypothetical protein ACFE96_14625 [Candidatus Hermodarchaeota archaeon]
MIKDSELNLKKENQKNEDFCSCGCVDQTNKLESENPLLEKENDKGNSCC